VEATISRLSRLSAYIRRSGVQHQDAKAASFVDRDDLGNDLTSRYAAIAISVLEHKFPAADELIRQRVAKSIAQRRNRFAYRRKHQQKLSRKGIEMPPAQGIPKTDRKMTQEQAGFSAALPSASSTPQRMTMPNPLLSNTSASLLDADYLRHRMKTPSSKASTVISGTTTQVGALAIPPPPKVDHSDVFECPYCFILCPIKEARGKYWRLVSLLTFCLYFLIVNLRHHIMMYLAPYICLFPDCNKPEELFRTSYDWIAHIQTEHIPLEWQCLALAHDPQSFCDQESYEEHMRHDHPHSFAESQLSILAQMSARPRSQPFIICPL